MKTLLFLALVLIVLCSAMAAKCPYTCTKKTCKRTGLFNWWRRCSTKKYTCYRDCPAVNGGWSSFRVASVGACSVTCGVGTQRVTKTRTCSNPTPRYGGRSCSGPSSITVSQTCRRSPCPPKVDGGWSSFKVIITGPCSVTCGTGRQLVTKKRTCTNPRPRNGGRPCSGLSTLPSSQSCSPRSCPSVDGGWTQYRTVSRTNCSVTCGNGTVTVTQTRDCTNPAPQHGGADCQGPHTRNLSLPCSEDPCPVDGGWTQFRTVSRTNCSVTCGNGTVIVTQTRDCTNPAPQHGGADCQGPHTQKLRESCSKDPCPADPNCTEGGQTYHPAPDPQNFYQCFNGTAFLQRCPETTVWNNTAKTCAHEKVITSTSSPSPFQTTTPSPTSATAPAPNPASCAENSRTAVPGNCANYNWCVNGRLVEMACAPGTLFDVSSGGCLLAANVKCDA